MRVIKKIMRWFVPAFAAVLSSLSIAAPLDEDPGFQQVLTLYTAPLADNTAAAERKQIDQRLISLQFDAYSKLKDFVAKAQIAFKTDKRPMVASIIPFAFEAPTAGPLTNGWRSEKSLFVWRGDMGVSALPLTLLLAPENGAKSLKPSEFNEFWLDYTHLPDVPLCVPDLNFQISIPPYASDSKGLQDIVASTGDWAYSLKPLASIDATRADWKEKDYGYLARRVLKLAPDENWRYVQSRKNGVIQRRLHVQLDNVEAIDIAVAPNTIVERINLKVGTKDSHSAGELVEFVDLQNIELSDGRRGIRLNLREALKKRFAKEWADNAKEPGKHHLYAQEIFIFISGEARSISKNKLVQGIVFLGKDMGEGMKKGEPISEELTLTSNVVSINTNLKRMVVDMRKLGEKGEIKKSVELRLLRPVGAASCAIRIEGMQAVSTYSGTIPQFARTVEDFSRRLGGVFNLTSPQYDQVESPGIVGYLPLSTLTQDEWQDGAVEAVAKLGANNQLQSQPVLTQSQFLPYRIVGLNGKEIARDKAQLISPVGAVLRAQGGLLRATTENNVLLVLEGRSRSLEISWPLTADINNKTWFYFGVGEGVEQINAITLTLGLADGSVVQRQVVPNQPLRLMAGEAKVRNVRLRILPTVTPYRFKLHEMTLFAPNVASYAQALTLPIPTPYNTIPKPVLQSEHTSVLEVQPGSITVLASNEPLRFSTPLNPKIDWVRGLHLNYRLPLTYKGEKACPLSLQFNWTNGKTERQVCFEKLKDTLFIPMANFIGDADKSQNLGALQSIDWVLWSATSGDRGLQESFSLKFSVNGWAMVSAADRLGLSPLFNAGRYPVFADAKQIKGITTQRYARKIWLSLEDKALTRILTMGGQIQQVENTFFTLDQVVAVPLQQMSWDPSLELTEISTPYAQPRWPKWLAYFGAILLAGVAWKWGWWSPGKAWALGTGSVKTLSLRLRWVLAFAGRWNWQALPALPYVNLAMGVLALGPGMWLAGHYGSSFAGIMLLAAAVLFAWGAYSHWREQRGQYRSEINSSKRALFSTLAMALGCSIWSLGNYKLTVEALWGFLPLLGAIYITLPGLYRLGRQFLLNHRGHALLGGWLALTLMLYGGGLLIKVADGRENYFFSFGALALVFMVRASLLLFEPRFRRLFPTVAERVYVGAGSLYFSGALLLLVTTAVVLSVNLQPIAEQLAIVAYYCLLIGTVQAAWALRKVDKKIVDIPKRE